MKTPGPDHPIDIKPFSGRVKVTIGDRVLTDSASALVMQEASYQPVYYVPRGDVDMTALIPTDHQTYCPYKGNAGYFSVENGSDELVENAVWTYEEPYPAMQAITGHLAFYTTKVKVTATAA